jgi:hypothetical protein
MTLNALCGRYDRPGGMNRNEGALGRTYGLEMQGVPLHKPPVSRVRGILAINGLSAMADPNPRCDDRGSCRSDTGS